MDLDTLIKRRDAVVARHEVLESVPGSGWHPDDPQARSEARAGMVPLSKRPVAIQADVEVYFVGPDADFILDRLGEFLAKRAACRTNEPAVACSELDQEALVEAPVETTAQAEHAVAVCASVCHDPTRTPGTPIKLMSQQFNAVLYGLGETKTTVVVTGLR